MPDGKFQDLLPILTVTVAVRIKWLADKCAFSEVFKMGSLGAYISIISCMMFSRFNLIFDSLPLLWCPLHMYETCREAGGS